MAKPFMATKSTHTPPPFLKAEHEPTPPQKPSETTPVKQEPQEISNAINPPTQTSEIQQQQQPHFINSVTELRHLSTSLSAFQRRYDELQEHLDFIRNSIDCKWPKHLDSAPSPPQPLAIVPLTKTPASDTAITPATTAVLESTNSEKKTDNKQPSRSELEYLCEMMCSRGLRKYMVSHISDIAKLREEVPAALKFAPKPAKLVLECSGRFFLQGKKAFTKDSPMIPARRASVLILECFLLMACNGIEIEPGVKEEAELAAVAWKKRLISEGGVAGANEIDARGLLLLLGCFGIPGAFKNEDIRNLIRSSNARKISDAVRRSNVLLARIPEIIEGMMKNKMEVEAVDIVYTFGVEDGFPPQTILTSFLRESKEAWKRTRKEAQGSFTAVNEANKKQLADLKSVIKCLEGHKIDPLKFLPGWKISEKISSLEKDIADLDKKIGEKMTPKRKANETESLKKLKTQEVKRPRFAGHGLQQQKAAGHVDGRSSYDGLTRINLLDGGFPGHINTYSASPSVLPGYGAGLLPENIIGSVSGSGGGVLATGVGAGMSAGTGGFLPTGSIVGAQSGVVVDKVGQVMSNDGQPCGWHGDAAFHERLIGHSFAGRPAVGVNGLYGPSPSLEGFVGLPNPPSIGVSSRSSTSDLYQFADAVLESESYHSSGSRTGGTVPPVVPAHHSSYLY